MAVQRIRRGGPTTLVAIALLFTGCAGSLPDHLLKPRPVTTEIPTLSWPMVALTIVDDRRNAHVAHEPLVTAIESTMRRATSVGSPADTPAFRLTVTVVRHEAAFTGGGSPWWTGTTELRALLATSGGETIASWRVVDTSQEWNLLGYSSGTEAAQDSLKDGLRTLLRHMADDVQFGRVVPGSGAVIIRAPSGGATSEPSRAEPTNPPASMLLCRQRADNVRGAGSWREAWLAEYQRCMAGH